MFVQVPIGKDVERMDTITLRDISVIRLQRYCKQEKASKTISKNRINHSIKKYARGRMENNGTQAQDETKVR